MPIARSLSSVFGCIPSSLSAHTRSGRSRSAMLRRSRFSRFTEGPTASRPAICTISLLRGTYSYAFNGTTRCPSRSSAHSRYSDESFGDNCVAYRIFSGASPAAPTAALAFTRSGVVVKAFKSPVISSNRPQLRNHLLGVNYARKLLFFVHNRQSAQVVLVEQLRYLPSIRFDVARNDVIVGQLRQPHLSRRQQHLHQRHHSLQHLLLVHQEHMGQRLQVALKVPHRLDRILDLRTLPQRDVVLRHLPGRRVIRVLQQFLHILPFLGIHLLQNRFRPLIRQL